MSAPANSRAAAAAAQAAPTRGTKQGETAGKTVSIAPAEKLSLVARAKPSCSGHPKGKVIFIDAVNEVTRERAQSFLKPEHQQRILSAYQTFADVPGFAAVATLADIAANAGNLSIPLYVKRQNATPANADEAVTLQAAWAQWQTDGRAFWQQMDALVETLDGLRFKN